MRRCNTVYRATHIIGGNIVDSKTAVATSDEGQGHSIRPWKIKAGWRRKFDTVGHVRWRFDVCGHYRKLDTSRHRHKARPPEVRSRGAEEPGG